MLLRKLNIWTRVVILKGIESAVNKLKHFPLHIALDWKYTFSGDSGVSGDPVVEHDGADEAHEKAATGYGEVNIW